MAGYGAVGISRIPGSGYRLDVNGAVRGSSWTNSDIRYKKNITPLNNSLEKILQLQGVEFEWRKEDFPDISFKDGKEIGLIGQEVKDIVPELVHVDEKGYIDMCYAKITPLLIEAVKELKAENEKLEERIASLEKK